MARTRLLYQQVGGAVALQSGLQGQQSGAQQEHHLPDLCPAPAAGPGRLLAPKVFSELLRACLTQEP